MSVGVVDTNIIIHYFRKVPAARVWVEAQTSPLAVTTMTWLEVMEGASGKAGQATCKAILSRFNLIYLTDADQSWAMTQIETYRLSRGVALEDCLIASVCYRLNIPIYTDNEKDFLKVLPAHLVIKPYTV
jgi:predicted nucleic acid-binding protein